MGKDEMTVTNEIARLKEDEQKKEWTRRILACRSSGLSVAEYCRQNGIAPKTYYYHLRKLREALCEGLEERKPIRIGELSSAKAASITIHEPSGLTVELTSGISTEAIMTVIQALKCYGN